MPAPSLGVHGLAGQLDGAGSSPCTVNIGTVQAAKSTVVMFQGGRTTEPGTTSDNYSNGYSQLGSLIDFTAWPNFGWITWYDPAVSGGANFTLSRTKTVHANEEITIVGVEVKNGGVVSQATPIETASGATATSNTVTTQGPAVLIALHGGDTGVSGSRNAVPNAASIADGWSKIESYELTDAAHVQVAIAVRTVPAAGTYSITWDHTPNERAILLLVAVEEALSLGINAKASGASSATTAAATTTTGSGISIFVTHTGTSQPTVEDFIAGSPSGNTWTMVGSSQAVSSYPATIWQFKNEGGARGASHTFRATAGDVTIHVQEVIGTSPVVDVNAAGSDVVTPFQSNAITPTVPAFLAIAAISTNAAENPTAYVAGGSFTLRTEEQDGSLYWTSAMGTREVTGGSGSYQSSWTSVRTSMTSAGHQIVAWKNGAGASVDNSPKTASLAQFDPAMRWEGWF